MARPLDLPSAVQTVLDGVYAVGGGVVIFSVAPLIIAGSDSANDAGMSIANGLIGVLGKLTNQDYGR